MAQTPSTLLFVSVLLFIITELSGRVESTDLKTVVGQHQGSLLIFPNLGRFTIVHLLNVTILLVGYVDVLVVWLQTDESMYTTILFAILVIFFVLPILETREYDRLLSNDGVSNSLCYHILFTVIGTILIPLLMVLALILAGNSMKHLIGVVSISLIFLSTYVGAIIYLETLKSEVAIGDVLSLRKILSKYHQSYNQ